VTPVATWRDWAALAKPRLLPHVALSALAGAWLADPSALGAGGLAALAAGTTLTAAGTMALNQWFERESDGRMARTRDRPLPAGRLRPAHALLAALAVAAVGVALLALTLPPLTAVLAAATLALYALVYTPLKRVTTWGTVVGYVPGALPVLGGWAATGAPLAAGGWQLFALVIFWQLPHVAALGWLLREDYRAGGLVMPGRDDVTGVRSARLAVATSLLLVPATIALAPPVSRAGVAALAALTAGLLILPAAWWLRAPDVPRARAAFRGTLLWLPLALGVMGVLRG